jgi:pimeloyl-ACP methyl ester carboxylesterase
MRRVYLLAALILLLGYPAFAEDKYFDSKGVKIRYVDVGTGDPIVLAHGILGTIESNWVGTGVLPMLATRFRVVALDLRGHGKSGKPHDRVQYGEEIALDILRLMDHLKIDRAHVIGYSLGGSVVGRLLGTHPGRFRSAVFGGSTPGYEWSSKDDESGELSAQGYEQGDLRRLIINNAPPGEPPPSEDEIKRRSAQTLAGQDRLAIAQVRRSYGSLIISKEQAAQSKVPTLLIVGSDDPALADVRAYQKIRPSVEVVVIQGATHNAPRNARARPEFTEAIVKFITSHR